MAELQLVHPAPFDLAAEEPRADHRIIAQMVAESASVLDVGCGDGALMQLLTRENRAKCRGLERERGKVIGCVKRGLSVVQGDAERDLAEFPSASFHYVVLSLTLQQT